MNGAGGMRDKKKRWDKLRTNGKLVDMNPIICIITLNVNRINTEIKKEKLSDWIF